MASDANFRDYAMGLLRRFRDWGDGTVTEKVMVVNDDGSPATFGTEIALDGTDGVGTGAGVQAGGTTPGTGIRGWLSTLVGLFQNGLAKVATKDAALTALGYAQQTMVATTVYTLAQIAATGSITPAGYTTVILTPELAGIRLVLDGTNPSTSRGTLYAAGEHISLTMTDMTKVKVCMATATVVTLSVEYCS